MLNLESQGRKYQFSASNIKRSLKMIRTVICMSSSGLKKKEVGLITGGALNTENTVIEKMSRSIVRADTLI